MNGFTRGPVEALLEESDTDNFKTGIYQKDWKGLLIARSNQNGSHADDDALIVSAFNAATALADMGYDAVKVMGILPELTEAVALVDPEALGSLSALLSRIRSEGDG